MSNETELRDFLKREAASTRKGGTILLVVGIVVVVAIVVYFSLILSWLRKNYQAKDFVDVASMMVSEYIDQAASPEAQTWVMSKLPGLMDQAKKELVAYMPKARKRAEELLSSAADDLAERIREEAGDQVSDIMLRHEGTIRLALDAASDIERSNAELALNKALEEEFEALAVRELDPNLPEYLRALEEMDAELTVLVDSDPEKLTDEQKLERELLQIIYTLLERNFGELRGAGAG